ncbi:hypothetical protein F4604DRAFT_1645330 [Suillus subluteus]|nr:hypothetical protein F4604DRAFT_1645330 [Suillus subluteus]
MPLDLSPLSFFKISASVYSRLSWPHHGLDVACGIAIFFGGNAAVSTLALQPLYGHNGIWHGWYNAPGCHAIVWLLVRTLLQGPVSSYPERLSVSLGIDGKKGPKYIASKSGTVLQRTHHLAYVLNNSNWRGKLAAVGLRDSPTPMQLIIMDLNRVPTEDDPLLPRSSLHSSLPPRSSLDASLPIIASTTSIVACAICARVEDWLSFMMILLGMVSSGITSSIMCTAKITLERLKPADGVPPGDGMLLSDKRIVILRGKEEVVNAVTKAKLRLKLKGGGYTLLPCAFIALSQVTLQLIYMPSGSLTGQLMFLLSLLVSGGCNLYLSMKGNDVQSSALIPLLDIANVETYQTNSRTTAAVLACLALCWNSSTPPKQILKEIVPVEPTLWKILSESLLTNIQKKHDHFRLGVSGNLSDEEREFLNGLVAEFKLPGGSSNLSDGDRELLNQLVADAEAAYHRYYVDYVELK